jgi:hypothetical protein
MIFFRSKKTGESGYARGPERESLPLHFGEKTKHIPPRVEESMNDSDHMAYIPTKLSFSKSNVSD